MDLIARLVEHLLRRIGARALTGFGLLVILVGITAYGLAKLAGEVAVSAALAALAALLLGWIAARGRIPGWAAAIELAAAGLFWSGLTAGDLAGPLFRLLAAAWQTLRNDLRPPPGLPSLAGELARQSGERFGGVLSWVSGMLRGAPPADPYAATLVWALLLWFAAAWGAWWLRRRGKPLAAAIPSLGLLALSLGYARTSVELLFPALAALFGLLAWNSYTRRERDWLRTQTDYAEDVPLDVAAWALIISVGLAGVATAAALPSPQNALRFTRVFLMERTETVERLGQSLGLSAKAPVAPAAVAGMPGELPRQHLLTGGLELSGQPALTIRVVDLPDAARNIAPTLPYLRQAAYDVYTGRGWSTSQTFRAEYPPGAGLPLPEAPGWPAAFEIQPANDNRLQALAPGELLSLDVAARVDWRMPPARELTSPQVTRPADPPDAFAATLNAVSPSSTYRVTAWITPADAAGLRRAGQVYPALVTARYLQAPNDLPERVRSLAANLTARSANPYDRALLIEAYLRRYAYRLDLPAPPPDRDLVDYFLFDLKAGYCDYNASAMVILARLAGIPARLAAGYALPASGGPSGLQPGDTGQPVPQSAWALAAGEQHLTEDYAHSWPELYFPGYGWVAFEPTAGRRARQLPAARQAGSDAPEPPPVSAYPLAAALPPPPPESNRALPAAIGVALLALGVLVLWQVDRLRWHGAPGLRRSFAAMRRQAVRLGLPVHPGTTPAELGAALAQPEANRLAAIYARAEYSPDPPTPEALEATRDDWLRLRRALWAHRIRRWLPVRGKNRHEPGTDFFLNGKTAD